MTDAQKTIQIVWETLNGVMHDIREGDRVGAMETLEDMILLLEEAGAN